MNIWNSDTDELMSLATDFLPEPWKTMVENEEIFMDSVPDEILFSAMGKAEVEFITHKIDSAEIIMGDR